MDDLKGFNAEIPYGKFPVFEGLEIQFSEPVPVKINITELIYTMVVKVNLKT
jgi:hypothetical protein